MIGLLKLLLRVRRRLPDRVVGELHGNGWYDWFGAPVDAGDSPLDFIHGGASVHLTQCDKELATRGLRRPRPRRSHGRTPWGGWIEWQVVTPPVAAHG